MVEEHRALVVGGRDEVDGVDHAERGVGDQLASLHRAGIAEEAPGGTVVRELRECRMAVAHRGPQAAELVATDLVRRPVLGVIGPVVTGEVAARGAARAQGVNVAQQVVAVLHAHAGHRIVRRPREIGAGELFEHVAVVDQRGEAVGGHEVDQMEPFSELHAGGVGRRADQVAAVVHVDVEVTPVPSVRGGIDQPDRLALDGRPLPGRGNHLDRGPIELQASGAR